MQPKHEDKLCFDEVNFKKYSTIFVGVFLIGILFGRVPSLISKERTPNRIGLPGSEMRQFYTKPPLPLEFKIFLFNLTNADEVNRGASPMLQEIGPYVFEEWKEKFNLTDHDEDDTLTFNMKKTFIFRPDLSEGLTGNEKFTTVHPLIMGMALAVNVNRKPMLKLVDKAVNAIFHHPENAFWTGLVMDYLFEGIEIDCTSEEFAAQAACSVFESGVVKAIEPLRKDYYKFSVFGAMNGSGIGMYKVNRGIKNLYEVGRVISFDNKTEMEVWNGDECNCYKGTDSTIFPPEIKKEDRLWAYEPNICLSIGAHYESDTNYQGIPTTRFGLDFGDARKNEELQCFCSDPPEDCPRRGTINLFECVEVPIIISLPHFYNADPFLLSQIQSGLNPDKNIHSFYIDYETTTGTEIYSAKRLQFNLDVVPVVAVETMKHIPEVVMPLFWVEEITTKTPYSKTFASLLKFQQQLFVLQVIQWIAIIIGTVGTIFSTYMYFRKRNMYKVSAEIPVNGYL